MQFDELAELYTSMTLRSLGFSLMGVFVPVYLYKNGVDLETLFLLFAAFFGMRIFLSFPIARLIGRIGPKHGIAMSTILLVAFLLMLLTYQRLNLPLLFLIFMFTLSNGLFFISTNIDFSKIKHAHHGGKELGWLYIFERLGSAAGPVAGGIIAALISPEATIVFAIITLTASIVPLFMSNEPVEVHQKVDFSGFQHRKVIRDYISLSGFNILNVANGFIWPLFLAAFVLVDDTYAKLGAIIGLSMLVSLVSARMFGKFIDRKKGGALLQYGSIMNVLLQASRAFVFTAPSATIVSSLGEPINLSIKMPLVKAFYDAADRDDNYRIVYVVWVEVVVGIAKALMLMGLYAAMQFTEPEIAMRWSFALLGVIGLLTLVQRFPALKRV